MTATAGAKGEVTVVYTYTYGCKNTFTLTMTPGADPAPGQVTSNECSYTAKWAGITGGGGVWIITIPTIVIVAVAFAALAGGTGFNINKRQMKGAEAVPFIGFWRGLPGLVKDGSMFSYVHGREFSLMVRRSPLSFLSNRSRSLCPSPRLTRALLLPVLQMYAKAMKQPYTPGPGYTPSASSENPQTASIVRNLHFFSIKSITFGLLWTEFGLF